MAYCKHLLALLAFLLLAPLALASGDAGAANPAPSQDCRDALQALQQHINHHQGQLSAAELDVSPQGDRVRLACDGSPQAYQRSLAHIIRPLLPTPAAVSAPLDDTPWYGPDGPLETAVVLLGIAAIIAGYHWDGVIVVH
ncbi:hypothetical protein [Chitinilyticum litopenaei]|uniref:hypothetical protein n=1 Tax=Chitinilyticum litopenaei TaxID=1121276 RepID=UPI000417B848|nr:hypothetical protein [Chitinilyticum litopenaei]